MKGIGTVMRLQLRKWGRRLFCGLGIILVYLILYAMNQRTGLYLDDFNYSHTIYDIRVRVSSLEQIWLSMKVHYEAMNGRVVLHFLDQLLLMHGRTLFDLLNPLAFCLLGLLIYYHGFGTFRNIRMHWLFFLYFALYFLTPAFGQSFLWATGACNYLYGIVFILLYLIPWRRTLNQSKQRNLLFDALWCIPSCGFGLLVGWTNENLSMALIAMELGYIVADLVRYRRTSLWKGAGFIGSAAGLICMMTAPGTSSRAALIGGYGSISDWIPRAFDITRRLFSSFWPLFLALILLLSVVMYQCGRRNKNPWQVLWFPAILLVGAGIATYSMSGSPTFPDRVWSGILALCLTVLTGLYARVDLDQKLLRRGSVAVVCVIGVVFCLHLPKTMCILTEVDRAYETREKFIQEQIELGNTELIVPPIRTDCRFAVADGFTDLTGNPDSWPNRIMAIYYGLDALTAGSDFGVSSSGAD